MMLRFLSARNCWSAILVVAVIAALPAAAFAQNDPRVIPPKEQQKKLPEAPSKLPKVGADRTRGLDFLFGALKAAPTRPAPNMSRHGSGRCGCRRQATPRRY